MAATEKRYSRDSKGRRVFISWRWLIVFIGIVSVAILVAILMRKTPLERGMQSLVEAFSNRRLIEPRLSGGFKAAPLNAATDDPSNINQEELARARELITDALAGGKSGAHIAYGRLLLSQGMASPDALKHLRAAIAVAPESADAHNDLGVYLIETERIEDAIDQFDLALKFNPQMPEAMFNRALCYRQLELRGAANDDLSRLAEVERDDGWLRETRDRMQTAPIEFTEHLPDAKFNQQINSVIASRDKETGRRLMKNYFEKVSRHSLALWEDYLAGDAATAQDALTNIEFIGGLAEETNKETTFATTINYMRGLPEQKKPSELAALRLFRQGLAYIDVKKYKESIPTLEQAQKGFNSIGNELFSIRTGYAIARSLYHLDSFPLTVNMLKANLDSIKRNGWLYDESRTLLLIGQAYYRMGQDSTALSYFNQSREGFSKLNEPEAKPQQSIGIAYWHLGDFRTALACLRRSTGLFLQSDPRHLEIAYNYLNIADIYRLTERYKLARLYAEQALDISGMKLDDNRAAQASSLIAIARAHAREFDKADEALKQAFDHIGRVQEADRKLTEPLVFTRAGDCAKMRGNNDAAIDYYTKAESLLAGESADKILKINALRGRAEARIKTGDVEGARLDLSLALSIIESYRENLINRAHRMEFLASSNSVFDEMISLDASDERFAPQAFETSERSRARSLLDDISSPAINRQMKNGALVLDSHSALTAAMSSLNRSPSLWTVEGIKAGLPEDITLIEYSVTPEKTFLFLIEGARFEMIALPVGSAQLAPMVSDYVSDITNKASVGDLSQKARELHRLLIEPIESKLSENRTLCIVPDKSLHFLPFAALKDSQGRYLIESHRIIYAPSASVLVECLKRKDERKTEGEEKLLSVGNPLFNKEEFAQLDELKDAEKEANGSASFYYNPDVLIGPDATEENVRRALKQCDVAHFALHCVVDQESPWTAALVLASSKQSPAQLQPGGGPLRGSQTVSAGAGDVQAADQIQSDDPHDGLLYLSEIYNLTLPRARLVVLSACETGLGQFYRGEGIVSLIHPFMATRVSTVVASLWPVESQATSDLMIEFHKARRAANPRAGDALRAAQLKMIEQIEAHPFYWASFVVVGGNY